MIASAMTAVRGYTGGMGGAVCAHRFPAARDPPDPRDTQGRGGGSDLTAPRLQRLPRGLNESFECMLGPDMWLSMEVTQRITLHSLSRRHVLSLQLHCFKPWLCASRLFSLSFFERSWFARGLLLRRNTIGVAIRPTYTLTGLRFARQNASTTRLPGSSRLAQKQEHTAWPPLHRRSNCFRWRPFSNAPTRGTPFRWRWGHLFHSARADVAEAVPKPGLLSPKIAAAAAAA